MENRKPTKGPPKPSYIVIHGMKDEEIGRLSWDTGELVFVGEADISAKVFFNEFLKPLVNAYLLSREK